MSQRYDPRIYHRRSIRLKDWDYTLPGPYFVTICTHQRQNLFDDERYLKVAKNAWQNIPNMPHAQDVVLDEWVVMPNHLHGILLLPGSGTLDTTPSSSSGPASSSLGAIIGNFKSLASRHINRMRGTKGTPIWQRGYYERIIRNERELDAIRKYIRENPIRWDQDRDNLEFLIGRMELHA